MLSFIFALTLFFISTAAFPQTNISGKVSDKNSHEALVGATVQLYSFKSESFSYNTVTDMNGVFSIWDIESGEYELQISYIGYKKYNNRLTAHGKNIRIIAELDEDNKILDEVSVTGRATRAEQKGDSLVYNAEAFKVMDGSNAETLLSKMPGIVVEGGKIQAQGEDVKKILVDGKEFFDGDINLAIKNLPSDIIANIEVFDKQSEQAEFTGFDDGEQIKTINIITKGGFRTGTFGRAFAGYGTENRYNTGGNINFFNEDRRFSILGMSNNINNQNFSQEDISGVMAASSQSGGKRNRKSQGGGTSKYDFMTGNLNGITSSDGIGINYADKWNDKMSFNGSYFFNHSKNSNEKSTDRDYFESAIPGMSYEEFYDSQMENFNHRINMKYDYNINRNNSLTIRPTVSLQKNISDALTQGANLIEEQISNNLTKNSSSETFAYNIGASVDYRHRFRKTGRTFSINLRGTASDNNNDNYYDYIQTLYQSGENSFYTSQYKDNSSKSYSYKGNIMYTDLITKKLQIQTNYRISYSSSDAGKITYDKSSVTDLYDMMNEDLSNVSNSGYLTHSAGIGLKYRIGKFNISGEANMQYSLLTNTQEFPIRNSINRNFLAVLPRINIRYSADRNNTFMLRYNSNTSSPSINDLQDIIDNSNPLFVYSGNPALEQQKNHITNLRYILTTKSGQSFIAMIGAIFRYDYIGDSIFTATENTTVRNGIVLEKGAQFRQPVNLDGYYSLQSLFTYGFPVDFLRSNINISISTNYARIPTISDGISGKTNELNILPKIVIGSNISTKVDFTISYSAGINQAFSSIGNSLGDRYISHNGLFKFGWEFWKGFIINNTLNYTGYTGLEDGNFNRAIWNISIGKKFLKNNACEINLSAYDILKQNKSLVRNVGTNYFEYVKGNVIEPYFMLSVIYNIR